MGYYDAMTREEGDVCLLYTMIVIFETSKHADRGCGLGEAQSLGQGLR